MKAKTAIRLLTSLGAVAVLVSLPQVLTAQSKVWHACYVPSTGTVYLIQEPGLPEQCGSSRGGREVHVPFEWTDGVDALQAGTAAGGDLDGTYPNPSVVKLRGLAVAATAPADGQVLRWNETNAQWEPGSTSGGTGVTDHGDLDGLLDDDHTQYLLADGVRSAVNGFAVTGDVGVGSVPASGEGIRMMWYPGQRVLRAGVVNGSQWDAPNLGVGSVAFGSHTTASGSHSFAHGLNSSASNDYSVALGLNSSSSGIASVAIGTTAAAGANYAFAFGSNTTASGQHSAAFGSNAAASGIGAVAVGTNFTSATANNAFAFGVNTTASGQNAFALGHGAVASSLNSVAIGAMANAFAQSAVAIGASNSAGGQYSVALGSEAYAVYDGSFVFADNSAPGLTTSAVANQFAVRAQHVWFGTGGVGASSGRFLETSTGAYLTTGGVWTSSSDVNRKRDFATIDSDEILQRLIALPIQSWSYREESADVRHIGPTAQDFHAAFGLGESNTAIGMVDADGVNMAAIQALERRTRVLAEENEQLRAQISRLIERQQNLAGDMATLRVRYAGLASVPPTTGQLCTARNADRTGGIEP